MNSNLEKAIKADIGYSEKYNRMCKNCDRHFIDNKSEMTESSSRCNIYAKGFSVQPTAVCNLWAEKQLKNM